MTMQMNEFFYGGNEKPHWQEMDDYVQRPYVYRADFDYRSAGRTLPKYEFRVPMCCSKCEEKVREELSEMEGVYEVFADQLSERVAVTGFVDPFQALKKMKRIKKKSEFWDGSSLTSKSTHSHGHSHHKRSSYRDSSHKKHETVYHSAPSQVSYNREPSRASSSHRKNYHASHGDRVSYSGHGLSPRENYGSYDDGFSYRNKYGSYDDGFLYRNKYDSYDNGVSYSDFHGPSSSLVSCLPRSRSLRYDTVPPFAQDYDTEEYVEDYPLYNRY